MGNTTYIEMLKSGVEVWNRFRKENPDVQHPDLSYAELSGLNLYWADLSGADLGAANLSGTELFLANLSGADLSNANLKRTNLTKADLSEANLSGANLSGANLSQSKLINANLSDAILDKADLEWADAAGANWTGASLKDASLKNTDLKNARIEVDPLAESPPEPVFPSQAPESPSAAPPSKKIRYLTITVVLLALTLTLLYLLLPRSSYRLVVRVPAAVKSDVFLNQKPLSPLKEDSLFSEYRLEDQSAGRYELLVEPARLTEMKSVAYSRYKPFRQTLEISGPDTLFQFTVHFDTLYTITPLADGLYPSIDPDGEKIAYIKDGAITGGSANEKKLYLFDLKEGSERELVLRRRDLYRDNWEWDRPYLRDNGRHLYLSGFNYNSGYVVLFLVDTESGAAREIPLGIKPKWLHYLPLAEQAGILVDRKWYSLSGEILQELPIEAPYQERLYYGGGKGVMYYLESEEKPAKSWLNLMHYDLDSGASRQVLKASYSSRPPYVSFSPGSNRLVMTDYSGMAIDFFSTIQLWAEQRFVSLTQPFLVRERPIASSFHKIEATADNRAEKIVFDYQRQVFLIDLPANLTLEALLEANPSY
ncbi:MAG: pentapeptide repeat-containing protein [Calditrichaeota bacterium]|nr:pentapeptide repeat-containing protein [Calditrichota bacterium]MCB0312358.1 pentapeptide repeat-containing protein [Calditrichota bacterium]